VVHANGALTCITCVSAFLLLEHTTQTGCYTRRLLAADPSRRRAAEEEQKSRLHSSLPWEREGGLTRELLSEQLAVKGVIRNALRCATTGTELSLASRHTCGCTFVRSSNLCLPERAKHSEKHFTMSPEHASTGEQRRQNAKSQMFPLQPPDSVSFSNSHLQLVQCLSLNPE
jgi:hypothetical protein